MFRFHQARKLSNYDQIIFVFSIKFVLFLVMKILKIRLELNDKQTTLAAKHVGVARQAYNWDLMYAKRHI
ncbi:MAG: hypothetical protein EAZ97_00130 [Bacteroidetes bacterium]|nr:MAG: hypothetical protein EAZ97_00130 [Bacteroidota bacterium]